mgnify:CR=1 FL=1
MFPINFTLWHVKSKIANHYPYAIFHLSTALMSSVNLQWTKDGKKFLTPVSKYFLMEWME